MGIICRAILGIRRSTRPLPSFFLILEQMSQGRMSALEVARHTDTAHPVPRVREPMRTDRRLASAGLRPEHRQIVHPAGYGRIPRGVVAQPWAVLTRAFRRGSCSNSLAEVDRRPASAAASSNPHRTCPPLPPDPAWELTMQRPGADRASQGHNRIGPISHAMTVPCPT